MRSPTTPTTHPELHDTLVSLGLHGLAGQLDDFLARVTKARLSPLQQLEELARIEHRERARRGLERRLSRARIGTFKPMADFDWNWPKKLDRQRVERCLALGFGGDGANVILLGPHGVGKTMILKNIAHAVCRLAHGVPERHVHRRAGGSADAPGRHHQGGRAELASQGIARTQRRPAQGSEIAVADQRRGGPKRGLGPRSKASRDGTRRSESVLTGPSMGAREPSRRGCNDNHQTFRDADGDRGRPRDPGDRVAPVVGVFRFAVVARVGERIIRPVREAAFLGEQLQVGRQFGCQSKLGCPGVRQRQGPTLSRLRMW